MKEPKVLLIYPPIQFLSQESPRPDGSLGLLYLAGALEKAGIQVDVIDAVLGPPEEDLQDTFYNRVLQPNGLIRIGMSFERIHECIAKGAYNIVGINSNFTPQTRMALDVARITKEVDPDILVVVGGVNARNLPRRFLESGCVDIIVNTEGEQIIVKVVQSWSRGFNPDELDGVTYINNGRPISIPPKPDSVAVHLDELPFPLWSKLPLGKYARVSGPHGDLTSIKDIPYAPIMTSRGCPFQCAYCHISVEKDDPQSTGGIGALRFKSVDRVLEEIRILRALGVKRLYFEDDSLLAKKARVKALFGEVKIYGLSIADVNGINLVHFQIKNRVTGKLETDRDYLEVLKDAGFDNIVFPVESGSQRILDTYATAKLNVETMDLVHLVKTACDVGITCPINMMIGFPDETEEEIMQTVELAKRLVDAGAGYCAFFIPTPFPGSQLYNSAVRDGYLDPNVDPDTLNIHRVAMTNTAVAPERLMELREWAWRTVNRKEYVEARLKLSVGSRWDPATP